LVNAGLVSSIRWVNKKERIQKIMKRLHIIRSTFALLAAITSASIISVAQENNAESDKKRGIEEQQLLDQAVAKIDQLRLKEHPAGKGEMLRKLAFADIQVMQIFRVNPDGSKGYVDPPLSENTIQGILALCKKAKPYQHPKKGIRSRCDYVMVVQLKSGQSFEIRYSSILGEPFGGLYSKDLKEALYFVSRLGGRCSLINFVDGKVTDVKHTWVGSSGQGLSVKMWLNIKGELVLRVKMYEKGKNTIDQSIPMHYGDAKVFNHKGKGHLIVLLHKAR